MARNTSGLKRGGGKGRKGIPNKTTQAARELAQELVNDGAYRAKLKARCVSGKVAPAVETMLWHYAYGKPKEQVELTGTDGGPVAIQTIARVIVRAGHGE